MKQNRPIALALRGISKRFDRPAVEALDLTVYGGEFYVLVGPNGAAGCRLDLHRRCRCACRSGCRQQMAALALRRADDLRQLTPYEYLEFVAGLWRTEPATAEARARELIGWLGLEPHAHERCEGFSKGMRQKVALAGALVHDPKLISRRALDRT
jgi:ABC-2 type transport system ATP-binding protein